VSKTYINPLWDRQNIERMRKRGKKVVSHGSYRAKRKPNSPRVRK